MTVIHTPQARPMRGMIVFVAALVLFIVFLRIIGLITDWFWFQEVGYQTIFTVTLLAKIKTGALFGAGFFILLYGNLLIALQAVAKSRSSAIRRGRGVRHPHPGDGTGPPQGPDPHGIAPHRSFRRGERLRPVGEPPPLPESDPLRRLRSAVSEGYRLLRLPVPLPAPHLRLAEVRHRPDGGGNRIHLSDPPFLSVHPPPDLEDRPGRADPSGAPRRALLFLGHLRRLARPQRSALHETGGGLRPGLYRRDHPDMGSATDDGALRPGGARRALLRLPARLALPGGRGRPARRRVGPGTGGLPLPHPEIPGRPQRDRRREALPGEEHPVHAPGLRPHPDRGAGVPDGGEPDGEGPPEEQPHHQEHPALEPWAAPADLQPAPGDADLLQIHRRRQRPLHDQRRIPAGDALPPGDLLPRPPLPVLGQRTPDLHPRLRASSWGR